LVVSDWWLLVPCLALVVDGCSCINHKPRTFDHFHPTVLHCGETDRNRREDVAFSGWYLYLQSS